MPPKEVAAARANVEGLRNYDPDPSRTQAIRHWHLDQMSSEDPSVALLHIAVTAGGQIRTNGLGLDPVHAELILDELEFARAQLAEYLSKQSAAPPNVTPLRKIA